MPELSQETPTLHARIREAILTLELAPGQRISERGLESAFGASRTPIRAALMRLASEGLVGRDGKAWLVAPIDLDEVRALYEFREALEGATVRLAIERASDDELEALVALAGSEPMDTPGHSVDGGTAFHLAIARLSGNHFLLAALDGVLTRLYRARWLEVRSAEARPRAHREHETLTAALASRDDVAAELAMLGHLRGTGERLVESLREHRRSLRGHGITVHDTTARDTTDPEPAA